MAVSIALYGLMAGIRGCFLDRFDVDAALDLVERFRVTAVVGVPTMFARLVNSNPDPARLESVRLWLSASDHLPSEVRQRLRQYGALLRLPGGRRIPPVLVNGYGMVELGGLAMMGIEFSCCPGAATCASRCRRFKSAWPMKTAVPCAPVRRASARFAVAVSLRTIGRTRAMVRAC